MFSFLHLPPACTTAGPAARLVSGIFLQVGRRLAADGLNAGKPTVKHEELTGFPHHVNVSGQGMPISCLACLDTG